MCRISLHWPNWNENQCIIQWTSNKPITCYHKSIFLRNVIAFSKTKILEAQLCFTVLQISLMSGLIEVSCIVLSASAFSLLPYHTSYSPWKLHGTLLREWEWKRPKKCVWVTMKIIWLGRQTEKVTETRRGPWTTLWEPLLCPREQKHRQKRVLNLGWWAWLVSPGKWEMARRQDTILRPWGPSLELSGLTRCVSEVVTALACFYIEI